jgi:hypothetical protein
MLGYATRIGIGGGGGQRLRTGAVDAGVAAVDVTPREAIWLSGYANRTRASEGAVQPIFVKAAAFRQGADGGAGDERSAGVRRGDDR